MQPDHQESRPRVLGVPAVAEMLDLHPETVQAMFRRGELPGRKVGKRWRITERALLAWLEEPAGPDEQEPGPRTTRV